MTTTEEAQDLADMYFSVFETNPEVILRRKEHKDKLQCKWKLEQ